ncbi:uncharacterized protein DSM5745_00331 [Aspergillus mulundensis]|uniref:Uncharacterized protein n=1 Tax=Aspergillus mulundensis TaxID=1810919 RepID=A0A3D8T3B1_9EURO|nr:hypothetical protein DSM5745_00331 [Aspergillus mulundensis]RDW93009.1 hypothetical protein DSM5745_00331 [Aspergillus mulundensis]
MDQPPLARQQAETPLPPVDRPQAGNALDVLGPGEAPRHSRKRRASEDDDSDGLECPRDAKIRCARDQSDVEHPAKDPSTPLPNDLHQDRDTDAAWIQNELDKITSSRQKSSDFLDLDDFLDLHGTPDFSDTDNESIFSRTTESTEAAEDDIPFREAYFLYLESFARHASPGGPGIPENFDLGVYLQDDWE